MTESPDRGAGREPARKTDRNEGTQTDCDQSASGSFRVVLVPHSLLSVSVSVVYL